MTASVVRTAARQATGVKAQLPTPREILHEQLRTIGFALRIPMLIIAALGVLTTIVFALQTVNGDMRRSLIAQPSSLPGIVGALLAIAVWAREERFGPAFLFTLPVDRSRHVLLKVLAGWLWLMAGVVFFAVSLIVLALIGGSGALPVETLHVLTTAVSTSGPLDPSALQVVRWEPGAWIWAVPFASATATYLLASAFMIGVRYPLRWVGGSVVLFAMASVASHTLGRTLGKESWTDAPGRALSQLIEGRFGLETLHTLRTWSLDSRATLTSGEHIQVWSSVPDLGDWRTAASIWLTAGALALCLAAFRHRETRRA